jgi:hypothetical protein
MIAMSRIDFGKKLKAALESNNNVQADPVETPAEPVVAATESTPPAEPAAVPAGTTPAQEGEFSNAIVGGLAGSNPGTAALHGAYRGHQIEELHKQLKEVDAEIAKTKAEIAEHHHQHHAATEGLLGAATGAAAGAVTSLASPIAGIGAGAAIGSSVAASEKLLSEKRAILASLKKKHVELLKAAHEALGGGQADLQNLIAAAESALNEDDIPATESAPVEPAAAEPAVASTESAPAGEPAATTEDFKGKAGAVVGGVVWTAAQKSAIDRKTKLLEELKAKIAELKKTNHVAEAFLSTIEGLDPEETYSEEGYMKHYKDEWKTTFKDNFKHGVANMLIGHKTTKNLLERAGKYGDMIKELNEKIKEARAEIARLEGEHKGAVEALKEEVGSDFSVAIESLFSLESEGVIAAPQGGTETIETDEAPHRVEDHLINADACGDVLTAHLNDAHKLHKAVIDLESLMDTVHGEAAGINQVEAKYVTLAVEHITSEFAGGIKLVPSIEAFGGPVSRQEATITMEANIAEVGKQIMAHLKELWNKFMAALKSMWDHLFGAASVLERDAGKLEARANALQGEPGEKTIDLGPLAHRVAIGGKVPTSLKDILTFMKLGELKSIAEKALDESEVTQAVQEMAKGGDSVNQAVDAGMREIFKTMPILGKELPGGVRYTQGHDGEIDREISDVHVDSTTIPVLSRVELIHMGHAARELAREAAAVLKDISAATSKDAGHFLDSVQIEDEGRAHAVARAANVLIAERKRGLKLVADAITDYLKAAQALVAIGNKCAAKYSAAPAKADAADGNDVVDSAGKTMANVLSQFGGEVKDGAGNVIKPTNPAAAAT